MSEPEVTPAARIEELRRMIPPREGRRSRLGYISKDDLADLIGAGRTTVINWTKGKTYPESGYRVKLAELSRGRFRPDDFAPPTQAEIRDLNGRLAEAETEVARMGPILTALLDRVEALERRASRGAGRGGAATR